MDLGYTDSNVKISRFLICVNYVFNLGGPNKGARKTSQPAVVAAVKK